MSSSSGAFWSDHPNAPKISKRLHRSEKASLRAVLLSLSFQGIIVFMFFQCMSALLYPTRSKGRHVRWPLVAHTVAMFSFTTVSTMAALYHWMISFLDNREFPGSSVLPPGPIGYARLMDPTPFGIAGNTPFLLNGWLADGLLLYRCLIIYSMNYWVVAFPCLAYLTSVGVGIVYLFQFSHTGYWTTHFVDFGLIYISITFSLNVILTLMIIARLVLHNKMLRSAIGGRSTPTGVQKFINTILVESCALYAISSLFLIGSWSVRSYLTDYTRAIFEAAEVLGPFLIALRVANRTALTSDVTSGNPSSIRFRAESTDCDGSLAVEDDSTSEANRHGWNAGEVGVEAASSIKGTPLCQGSRDPWEFDTSL